MTATTTLETLAADYTTHAARMPVAASTHRLYAYAVQDFLAWLGEQTKYAVEEVITDPMVATQAVRAYKRHLLTVRKLKPKSVDSILSGVSSFFLSQGMDRPAVPLASPKGFTSDAKSLDEEQVRDVLQAAERRGIRDHTLVALMYATGARIAETAALDADDLDRSARKVTVLIRAGKGDKPRPVPVKLPNVIQLLNQWVRFRRAEYGLSPQSGPLFVNQTGERLAVRSIRHVVGKVGEAAGVPLNPHMLRHTFGRTLIDQGNDVSTVAALMGHSSLATTMVYTRPRAEHLERAVAGLAIEY